MSVDLSDFESEFSFSNYPIKGDDGFVRAKLIEVKLARTRTTKQRNSKELQDDTTVIVTRFSFLLEGASKPINSSVITGTNLNPLKVHVKAKGRGAKKEQPEYNAFTEMCLRTGFITLEQLNSRPQDISTILKEAFKAVSQDNPVHLKTQLVIDDEETNHFEKISIKTIAKIEYFEFNDK